MNSISQKFLIWATLLARVTWYSKLFSISASKQDFKVIDNADYV